MAFLGEQDIVLKMLLRKSMVKKRKELYVQGISF